MDHLAVRDAVLNILSMSATRIEEDSNTLRRPIEKIVARGNGRQDELYGPAKQK